MSELERINLENDETLKEMLRTEREAMKRLRKGPKQRVPPGLVIVAAGDTARYHNFTAAITKTVAALDAESAVMWAISSSVADNCNVGARALLGEEGPDWAWVMGDDHEWDERLLPSLLETMYAHDLDILVPLCFARSWPPRFVVYEESEDEDDFLVTMKPEKVADILRSGDHVREVAAAGTAAMLIRRRVFEAIEPPWFRNVLISRKGMGFISQTGEDLNFCSLARAHGFRIHAHFGLVLGHIRAVTLLPEMTDDGLHMRIFFGAHVGPYLTIVE